MKSEGTKSKRRPQFSREMRDWLGIYRKEVLSCPEWGVWRDRPYHHILSANDSGRNLNLLEGIRSEFMEYAKGRKIRFHRDFAHLNSSQALAFNLFFPLLPTSESGLSWGRPERISELLDLRLPELTRTEFEKIVDSGEGTNLDWWGEFQDGTQIFCEVKFTESGFGTANSKSTDYGIRLDQIYRPKLEGIIKPGFLDKLGWFRAHYQILRNLAHLTTGPFPDRNRMLFILPARSPAYGHLKAFRDQHLEPDASDRMLVKGLEPWTERLATTATSQEEGNHWREFREKYCPDLPLRGPGQAPKVVGGA